MQRTGCWVTEGIITVTLNVWIKWHRIVDTLLLSCERRGSRGRIECLSFLQTPTRNFKIIAEYYIGRDQHHRELCEMIRLAHVSRATNYA